MSRSTRVVVRADASASIGLGHVMRCLQLAGELSLRGASCSFLSAGSDPVVNALVRRSGHDLHALEVAIGSEADLAATVAATRDRGATLLLLDGYGFDRDYIAALRKGHAFVCVVDDVGDRELDCDAILNPNFYAADVQYRAREGSLRMLGPEYGIVGDNFLRAREDARRPLDDACTRVLVTMGGADPARQSEKVRSALERVAGRSLEVRVLIGPANAFAAAIEHAATRAGRHRIEIVRSPVDVAAHMAWCDVALAAAGTTCMELACVGVPSLVVAVAENQVRVAEEVQRRGLMRNLGWHADLTEEAIASALDALIEDRAARHAMISRQQRIVDGLGKKRAIDRLVEAIDREVGRPNSAES